VTPLYAKLVAAGSGLKHPPLAPGMYLWDIPPVSLYQAYIYPAIYRAASRYIPLYLIIYYISRYVSYIPSYPTISYHNKYEVFPNIHSRGGLQVGLLPYEIRGIPKYTLQGGLQVGLYTISPFPILYGMYCNKGWSGRNTALRNRVRVNPKLEHAVQRDPRAL